MAKNGKGLVMMTALGEDGSAEVGAVVEAAEMVMVSALLAKLNYAETAEHKLAKAIINGDLAKDKDLALLIKLNHAD